MNTIAGIINIDPTPVTKHCEIHGEFKSTNVFGSVWTKCGECNRINAESSRISDEQKRRANDLAAYQRKIGDTGIPKRFQNRFLETFIASNSNQKKALAFAMQYAKTFDRVLETGRSVIFCGRPGTGKTHLAAGIGLHILRESRTVLFTTTLRAVGRVTDTWSRNATESKSQAIAALAFPDLLILDEVGVQFGSKAEEVSLFEVINERYENHKPTLLISNLTANEVKGCLGERIFDRLREDGGECVVFDWDSHRPILGKDAAKDV